MKLNRQNKIIVGVLALILTITVGYAVFSQSLNITGTAKAEGNFSLIFSSVGEIEQAGSINATANISTDGKTLSVSAPNLQYPSAYVNINAKIKNEGTVKAILKKIEIKDENNNAYSNDNNDITVTYSKVKVNDIFESNEEKDILITITWKKESIKKEVNASFNITLEYEQATSLADSGSVEGGSESDWTFKTNDTGTITAYNYEKGSDVVVPAEVDGVAVTTITANSFKQEANLIAYMDEDAGKMYMVIKENEPNFSVVKDKVMLLLSSECEEGDTECLEQYKQMIYICTDENSCYNVKDEEAGTATVKSIPQAAMEAESSAMLVDTDPNVSLEDSFNEPKANIANLDLSGATNLTTIEENSFRNAGLQSVNFGENSNLKTIGNDAFSNNQISTLTIPESVEEIGNYAFSYNNITSVTFKQNVNTLTNNSSVKTSYLSENNNKNTVSKLTENNAALKTIGNYAFYGNQISSLTIPNSVTTIGDYAFENNQLSELIIPSSVTTIGYSAFSSNQISSLTIPKTVTSLGYSAFSNNPIETLSIGKCTTSACSSNSFGTQVKTLTIESGEIGFQAFYSSSDSATKLESLTLGDEVTSIGYNAFSGNQISSLAIPKTVTSLESSAFENNPIETLSIGKCTTSACSSNSFGTQIKTLTIESGEIGFQAFYSSSDSATKLESLTLGDEVTSIGYNAFSGNQISSLAIPKTVTSLESSAFENNPIETLSIGKCTTSACSNNSFGTQIKTLTIESGEIGDFAFNSSNDSTTKLETLTLGDEVTQIGTFAFSSNQISSLTIPNSVTIIGDWAFKSNQISSLTIPKAVETIGGYAFSSNQISSLTFEENSNLTTIGEHAFQSNQISGELIIPSGVITIGYEAFSSNQISNLTIPNTVTSLGINTSDSSLKTAFQNNQIVTLSIGICTTSICNQTEFGRQIKTLTIESGEIGSHAFEYKSAYSNSDTIESLTLGDEVTQIGTFAFSSNQISSLTIPNSVTSIGKYAFYSNQISSLTFEKNSSLQTIGKLTFYENQISGKLIIPNSVTEIGDFAFASNQISSLTIPSSVTSIGTYAFSMGKLNNILIKRTEEDFLVNVTVGNQWYLGSPTITYEP